MEVQVTGDMIAIIGAAVALGVGMFGSTRWIHKDGERLRDEMSKLIGVMSLLDSRLSGEIRESENRLRGDLKTTEGRLVGRMDKVADRLTNVGDRLSKVEGVIEGVVWGARHLSPDTPKEGAA